MPAILLLATLIACATRTAPPPAVTPTGRIDVTKPGPTLACTEFAPLSYSTGKPGLTVQDLEAILAAHKADDPLGWARAALGDTMTTRGDIAAYQARRTALGC